MSEHKPRIISHMNKDHQLALIDYLVVYGGLQHGTFKSRSVKIADIDLNHIDIVYELKNGKANDKTLKWADIQQGGSVDDWRDIKDKLVAMAEYAANKQGYSHKQITQVLPPKKTWFMYGVYPLLGYASYDLNGLRNVFQNDMLFQKITKHAPSALWSLLDIVGRNAKLILFGLLAAHFVEVVLYTIPKTKYYRVPLKQRLTWCFMHLFEGFFVMNRFKTLIRD